MGNLFKKIKTHWKDFAIGLLLILLVFAVLSSGIGFMSKSLNLGSSYDSVASQSAYRYTESANSMYYQDDYALEEEVRKIVKNADLDLETDNYDGTISQIEAFVNSYDVIILSENEYTYKDDYRRQSYTFKIDSTKVENFVKDLETTGEVQNVDISVNDVTGVYTDYSDRLERYQNQIIKYESMLNRNGLEIEDEIKIQNRIDNLEDSIFYLKNRIGSIDEKVTYSTVTVNVRENQSVWSEIDFLGLKDGFSMFMESLQSGIEFILLVFGFILPFGIIYGIYRLIKRFI